MEQIQKYLAPGFGPEETTILLDARGLAAMYQDWRSLDSMGDRLETIVKSIRL